MMKSFLTRWLLSRYMKENREITKIAIDDEISYYTMKDYGKISHLLKSVMTAQVMRHYEATTEEERLMAKGAASILKIIKDAHEYALNISDVEDKDKRLKGWAKFKKGRRIN